MGEGLVTWPESRWCRERFALDSTVEGWRTRTVLTCVDALDHDPQAGHRSGTDPVIRWRTNPQDPNVTDAWIERWRDWAGRTVAERRAAGVP